MNIWQYLNCLWAIGSNWIAVGSLFRNFGWHPNYRNHFGYPKTFPPYFCICDPLEAIWITVGSLLDNLWWQEVGDRIIGILLAIHKTFPPYYRLIIKIMKVDCVWYGNIRNSTDSVRHGVGLFVVRRNNTESLPFGWILAFWPSLAIFFCLKPTYIICVTLLTLDNSATVLRLQGQQMCKTGELKIVLRGLCGQLGC